MTALEDYAAKRAGRLTKAVKAPWEPPTLADFRGGAVVAFDPSLSATGMVAMQRTERALHVVTSCTIRTVRPTEEESKEGPQEWMWRARALRYNLTEALWPYAEHHREWTLVSEAPPTGRNRLDRPESSLLANNVIHVVADDLGMTIASMITVPKHKKCTGGNGSLQKKQHHDILKRYCPDLVVNWEKVTNADERDAASVAMTWLRGDL